MTCHDSPTLCEFENQWEMQPSDKTSSTYIYPINICRWVSVVC